MTLESVLKNYIISMMKSLIDLDKDPSFCEFQNTDKWIEVRKASSNEAQKYLILLWDEMYERLEKQSRKTGE